MRVTTSLSIAAAALLAAVPAAAQNAAAPANTTATTTTTTNEMTNTTAPTGAAATPGNEVAPLPPANETAAPEAGVNPAPAPEEKKGFPWGIIGLIGLIGLIPRRCS